MRTRRRFLLGTVAVLGAPARVAGAGSPVGLFQGEALGRYGFPDGHPLGVDRQGAFLREVAARGLDQRVRMLPPAAPATVAELTRFHTAEFVAKVRDAEAAGLDYLDGGDTPVFPGVFETASIVVGTALDGLARVMRGECARTFQPIGGLHHAGRGHAAGFCVFNDLGVLIETLRAVHGVRRVGYVDIDVHHGDGVFYAFEDDPDLILADIHEDGHRLYPGTGHEHETGRGRAAGTKLNVALPPGAGDAAFAQAWRRVEAHLERHAPEFVVFQCGADGLRGDPLAHLTLSPEAHRLATTGLRRVADRHARGRLMAFGGGGYDRRNLAHAWTGVLAALLA